MLEIKVLKPLAIKSLIAYSIKNKDQNLFNNMLNKSLDRVIDLSWIQKDIFKFCIQNNNWNDLSNYLEKKISASSKTNKELLSITYFQTALRHYYLKETNNAKKFLRKAIQLNNFFPPFMELYCKLNLAKNQNQLIKILKKYWLINPNPNIEQCLENSFTDKNALSKLKIISKILVKNNHLYYKYLILGKLKYKAKIWGSSKSDLKKSISFKPSKEAYLFLYKIEKQLKRNENLTQELKSLYDKSTNDIYWKCSVCKLNYNNWYSFCNSCNSFNSIQSIKINENNKVNKNNQLINSGSLL
jgi:lipopolysaccharide biosynthesis regulator YciM